VDLLAFLLFTLLRLGSDDEFSKDELVFCYLSIFLWCFCYGANVVTLIDLMVQDGEIRVEK